MIRWRGRRVRRVSDRFKLPLRAAVPLILVVFAVVTGLYGLKHYTDTAYRQIEENASRSLRSEMGRLQETLEYLLRTDNLEQINHEMAVLAADPEVTDAFLVDDWGELVAGIRRDRTHMPLADVLANIPPRSRPRHAETVERVLDTLGGAVYVAPARDRVAGIYPVFLAPEDGELRPSRVGLLFIEEDISVRKALERRQVEIQVLRTSAFLLLLAACLWLFFHYAVTRRVARLVAATADLARGDLATRSGISGQDEIGRMGVAIDHMAAQLEHGRRQLVESEERVLLLLQSTAEAIFGLDLQGRCTFCNPAALEALGLNDANQMLGRNVHAMMHHTRADGSPYPEEQCPVLATLREGVPVHVEDEVLYRADGSRFPAEYWAHPISREGQVVGAVVTFLDITHRRQVQEALRRAHDDLELRVAERTRELVTANRRLVGEIAERERIEQALLQAKSEAEAANHAKSEFLSRMSHELRTPMNAILGFSQVLESDPVDPLTESQADSVHEILRAGYHLLELINEVLDLSRIEAGHMEVSIVPVEVGPAVADALHLVGPLADRHSVSLADRTGAQGDVQILADPTRLRQVLLNLLSNAVKYNRPEGRVTVFCERGAEGLLRVVVEDTGLGVGESQQRRLFQPFTRLTDDYTDVGGTGIGLTITRRLMELMGGHIGFHSVEGEGSRFFVDFPLAESAGHNMSAPPPDSSAATVGGEGDAPPVEAASDLRKVLYIEDNQANMELMRRILARRDDLEMIPASNGGDGLEAAFAHCPDVVLVDIHLPDMDGFEVLRRLRGKKQTCHIPVLAFSGDTLPHDVQKGLDAGFFRYLSKPTDIRSIMGAIDAALGVTSR
ncbi:MAG: ATP-binding protein [Nitrospirota bacterium]|nr:ATP-binding protein [Nitrospirota bacterium]